ncbi:MAG: glycosyltransferase family 4 protein [Ignavibacteriae bacterium]|nr:glycosyltransferase family 4 protein [Ignavibacteriota bacterium]
MRILLTNSTTIFAGGEDYVLILAKYLRARGHAVHISAIPGHLLLEKAAEAGIPTVPIPYGAMNKVFQVSRMLRGPVRALGIDIVHSNANYDRTCAAIAAAWTPARHVAGIHSTHSIQHNITHLLRNTYGTAHFITDADAGREVLIKEDHIPADRITTVPIGIEEDPPEVRAAMRVKTRQRLGVADDVVVIGNVARLVPFKGHRVLLDAIAIVVREHPKVLFPIIGDGELQDDLSAQARTLGIEAQVRFLGFQDHLEEWYPAFDIYTHSSLELAAEMFPIAILRALAAALPVVCTRVGGIALMLEEGVTGHLVQPDDPPALAAALNRVVHDPALRSAMGAAAGVRFKKNFHAAAMAERVEQVYLRALQER